MKVFVVIQGKHPEDQRIEAVFSALELAQAKQAQLDQARSDYQRRIGDESVQIQEFDLDPPASPEPTFEKQLERER